MKEYYAEASWIKQFKSNIQSAVVCYNFSKVNKYTFSRCSNLRSVLLSWHWIHRQLYAWYLQFAKRSLCSWDCIRYLLWKLLQLQQVPFNRTGSYESMLRVKSRSFVQKGEDEAHFLFTNQEGKLFHSSSVQSICSSTFYSCGELNAITIPNSVTSIGSSAFREWAKLTSVVLPNSVMLIGEHAFCCCNSLTIVTIHENVASIDWNPFGCCKKLQIIGVVEWNPCFSSMGGVLFNRETMELVSCPRGKSGEYTIPTMVTAICRYTLGWCSSLDSVVAFQKELALLRSMHFLVAMESNQLSSQEVLLKSENIHLTNALDWILSWFPRPWTIQTMHSQILW